MPRPPSVLFQTPDQQVHRLHPGGIIGRLASAALRLDDPRVSEAHALLSLRGRSLKLLALRGALGLRGKWLGEVALREDQRLLLAEDVALGVLEVVLPDTVMALEQPDGTRVELDRPELSISLDPLRTTPGATPDAAAWAWCSGDQWWVQLRGERPRELSVGHTLSLGDTSVIARALPLPQISTPRTATAGKLWPPMHMICWPQHTEIHVEGRPKPARFTRNAHNLLRESALATQGGGTVHWAQVAQRIWRFGASEDNWYTNLSRLRKRLHEQGLPSDLLRCEDGQVQLTLRPGVDALELR